MRILVVSQHHLVGQSLAATLRGADGDEPVTAESCDPALAPVAAQAASPDVIIVEAVADFAASLATVLWLADVQPDTPILVLAAEDDEASVFEAVNAGADGYLAGEASLQTLSRILAGLKRGELGLPRAVALRVVRHMRHAARQQRQQPAPDLRGILTPREQEVFDLVRRGLRSREMSERLCIAEATVYKHIQNVLEKLQVHSRAQAILVAQFDATGIPPSRAGAGATASASDGANGATDRAH